MVKDRVPVSKTGCFLTGQVSLLCSILLCTQLLYSRPLLINDISLLASNGTNCLNLVVVVVVAVVVIYA